MGTLFIDRKETVIKLDGDAIAFYSNGKKQGSAPLNPFRRVVIVGGEILIETRAIHKLAEKEISVLFLSGKNLKFKGMLHGRIHYNGILRLKQYEKSLSSFATIFAREIIYRKVNAQMELIDKAIEKRTDLKFPLTKAKTTLENVLKILTDDQNPIQISSLVGFEGSASNAYFQAYTTLFADSLNFNKRVKRPPTDPVNAMLSLCYTMLHFEMVREIETIGLDPTIGFYHQFEYGRESLACDLVEPFRTEIDMFVWNLFRERIFTSRDFTQGEERPGVYLKKCGRKRFYETYEEFARNLRPKLTEEVRNLSRRILDGKDIISV